MTLKSYLIIMSFFTAICWLAFVYIIWTINPDATNWIGFLLFYLSLFLSLIGTATLIGFVVRFVFLHREIAFRSVRDAFRQSFFFSFFITTVLFLITRSLFNWLNVILLIIGLSIIEFIIISLEYKRPKEENFNDTNYGE